MSACGTDPIGKLVIRIVLIVEFSPSGLYRLPHPHCPHRHAAAARALRLCARLPAACRRCSRPRLTHTQSTVFHIFSTAHSMHKQSQFIKIYTITFGHGIFGSTKNVFECVPNIFGATIIFVSQRKLNGESFSRFTFAPILFLLHLFCVRSVVCSGSSRGHFSALSLSLCPPHRLCFTSFHAVHTFHLIMLWPFTEKRKTNQ